MDSFEVTILRVLIKRHEPLKLSALVDGFPDSSEDHVLAAISRLRKLGYLELSDYSPTGKIALTRQKRRDALKIIESTLSIPAVLAKSSACPASSFQRDTSDSQMAAADVLQISPVYSKRRLASAKNVAMSIALAIGLFGLLAIGGTPSLSSPDLQLVAYHHSQAPFEQIKGYSGHFNLSTNRFIVSDHDPTVLILEVSGNRTAVVTFDAPVAPPHEQILS